MDTTSSTVAACLIVVVGQWSKKNGEISIKLVVGMMFLVLMLSLLSSANEKLAKQFSTLILVGAIFTYFIPISKKLGFTK